MANKKRTPPSIAALIPGGGMDAGLQEKFRLQGHDAARRQAAQLQQQTDAAAHPTQGLHPLADGDVGSDWGAFFESLQEQGATIGSKIRGEDPLPGLTSNYDNIHTVAPSLQGLTPKTGRALALQQQDQINARQTAFDNPSVPDPLAQNTRLAKTRQSRGY